jgi:hypothetical protein
MQPSGSRGKMMAYYPDLSGYEYHRSGFRVGTRNVGWLSADHSFDIAPPREGLLDALWACCRISVAQMRGGHDCDMCPDGEHAGNAERNGEKLLLGNSEIRVFSDADVVYAAPTLIYHYVERHQYSPPDDFVRALLRGPLPPDPRYFTKLERLGLEWSDTLVPSPRGRFRL